MTDAPAAIIEATFCAFKSIGGRKQLQLIFEVPLEYSQRVLTALGAPSQIDPPWVAIALLDKKLLEGQGASAPVSSNTVSVKERRSFDQLPMSQQAALRCEDRAFRRFLEEDYPNDFVEFGGSDPVQFVRWFCCVNSRSDIREGTFTGDRWVELRDRYDAWRLV